MDLRLDLKPFPSFSPEGLFELSPVSISAVELSWDMFHGLKNSRDGREMVVGGIGVGAEGGGAGVTSLL